MSALLAELEQRACTLAPDERAHLVEVLLESLHDTLLPEIEAEWEREISNRVAAFDSGESETIAAEEVFADARQIAFSP